MICPNCGNECDNNQMFCSKCGTKVNSFMETEKRVVQPEQSFDNIIGGISTEEDEEMISHTDRNLDRELKSRNQRSEPVEELEDFEEDDDHLKSKQIYRSSHSPAPSTRDNKKKMSSKKKTALLVLLTVFLVISAVLATLGIKKATMTKRFNRYFSRGNEYYKIQNYKDAKTQYINASNNAFTKEQKIKSYEMVCEMDSLIGGYEQEQIKYLELLIDVDDSNIDYYKELIVLYQNNDMDNKIEGLIHSAPESIREELQNFDGTIPTPNIEEGTYDKPLEIELTASNDVKIYYTLDGSNVKDSATRKEYTTPIILDEEGTFTIRAYSVDKRGKDSKEISVKYTLNFKAINAPEVNLKSGTYENEETIKVTADTGCDIYYTKDGSAPTKDSKLYDKEIKLPKGNTVFYFVAINREGVSSSVVTRVYSYEPKKLSYNESMSHLKSYLISIGKLENQYGEFANGDVAYLNYVTLTEIDKTNYYIISCDIEDKNGAGVSSSVYAVSCKDGACQPAGANGNSYTLGGDDFSDDEE